MTDLITQFTAQLTGFGLMAKREPKHVESPDQEAREAPRPKRQFIPESTLWNRLRLRKQK